MIDLFEIWALESGFWIRKDWQNYDNPAYMYAAKERIKIDFEEWKKKREKKSLKRKK